MYLREPVSSLLLWIWPNDLCTTSTFLLAFCLRGHSYMLKSKGGETKIAALYRYTTRS